MTPDVIANLQIAFAHSLTDEEACIYAWIVPSTLYRYCDKHPDFKEYKELIKKKPNIKAKMIMVSRLNWEKLDGTAVKRYDNDQKDTAKWWLERKAKDEFSLRQEVAAVEEVSISEDELRD